MYAYCVHCPMNFTSESVDATESWAFDHEIMGGPKHVVKIEGYEDQAS
ncbi:hypothetical protein HWB99_gp106 [Mycobacterium phage DrLupo]|uniref:Uncharacterized protein n=1 Tax=Mycobacterium phage DrLupo TaxID=2499037 RepID=A0A3S9UQT2_9CAUD|nr:hypothetical protein HWB99_gp106 [Mycobacterium phage DrLupo]AZS12642.1 hypothetical protein SEA_DRLUPO_106 [Mycobacterium phage DrLupo]